MPTTSFLNSSYLIEKIHSIGETFKDPHVRKQSRQSIILILSWYVTSLSLSFYNKWLFAKEHYDFPFPLFTTFIHTLVQFSLSGISVLFIVPKMKPKRVPKFKDYVTKVFPCGLATGLDIGLSNASLKVISLSFYTMVKSGAPVFVLLFAFLFRLEKPTLKLIAVIIIICLGVLLMVIDETKFDLLGYIEVQVATILSGLRWALTQILLEKESMGMNNPLATNLFLTPLMAISLLTASIVIEGFGAIAQSKYFQTPSSTLQISGLIAFGGILAFLMILAEFRLISATSVVTFSIAGICKEILTISISAAVFGDEFTPVNILGLIISIIGIAAYNYIRISSLSEILSHHHQDSKFSTTNDSNNNLEDDEQQLTSAFNDERIPIEDEYGNENAENNLDEPLSVLKSRNRLITSSLVGYHPVSGSMSIENSEEDLFNSGK